MTIIQFYPIYPSFNSVWKTDLNAQQMANVNDYYYGPLGYQAYPFVNLTTDPTSLGGLYYGSSRKKLRRSSRKKLKKFKKSKRRN